MRHHIFHVNAAGPASRRGPHKGALAASFGRLVPLCLAVAGILAAMAVFTLTGVDSAAAAAPATLSVRSFGAVGDGVTDDSKAIQAAFRAAGPKVVVFPAGTYCFSRIVLLSDTSIVFEKGAVARLHVDRAGTNFFFATWASSTAHKANISLQGGRFSGPAYAVLWTNFTDHVTVTGVTSEGTDRLIQTMSSTDVIVKDCSASDGLVGFHFLRSSHVTVTGCTARNMKLDGILFYDRSRYVVADRNTVDGYALRGDLYRAGIHVYGSLDARITNNKVLNGRSDSTGIRFRDAERFFCAYNTVTSPGNRGLATAQVGDFSGIVGGDGTFLRNTVTNAKLVGIDIYPKTSKAVRVIDNVVSHTRTPSNASYPATALRVFTPKSVVIGNVLEYTDGVGLRTDGSGILVARNTIYLPLLLGTGQAVGMRILGTGHAIVENTVTDSRGHMAQGIIVLRGASALLRANTVRGASSAALLVQGAALTSVLGDTSPPVASSSVSVGTTSATVKLTATDNKAGVKAITYIVDSGKRVTAPSSSASVVVKGSGIHTVKYSAIDGAGNCSAWATVQVRCP